MAEQLDVRPNESKSEVFTDIEKYIDGLGLGVTAMDNSRPWGGFFVINEADTDRFIQNYFPDIEAQEVRRFGEKLSPKILLVAPEQRLSWQFHHRRAELWRVVGGPVGVVTSENDSEGPAQTLSTGDILQHDAEIRHRLIGLSNWGVLAEIWQHTDPAQPSDEEDIVRVQDDYGRSL